MNHEFYMYKALELAKQAEQENEVPVGAVVILNDEIIGKGYNQSITLNDPCAHAEILALRNAAQTIKNYRLLEAKLYVTLEPCAMCAAAMVHARIKQLIYAADDQKTGVVKSHLQFLDTPIMNHNIVWVSGIMAQESSQLLKNFFKLRRN